MIMELLQLRYFYESAKTESFAKTAEKFMVPATSVSASVKRLEKELGCPLFTRSCNRIMLNEDGRTMFRSLHAVFNELDEAIGILSHPHEDTREIKLLVRAMRQEITDCIIEYKLRHPKTAFKTVFDFGDNDTENYDIIIDEKNNNYPQYASFELFTTQIRIVASSKSHLAGRQLTLKQLSGESFISIGEKNSLHNLLMDTCQRAGFIPNIVMLCNDIQCTSKCIKSGVGIGLSRDYPQKKHREGYIYLNVADFNEKQTICAFYKKQSAYGNILHFLNFLKSKGL